VSLYCIFHRPALQQERANGAASGASRLFSMFLQEFTSLLTHYHIAILFLIYLSISLYLSLPLNHYTNLLFSCSYGRLLLGTALLFFNTPAPTYNFFNLRRNVLSR